jgi:hypothetical protein
MSENTPLTEDQEILNSMSGRFIDSLKRSNKQIRDDRAAAIAESAQMHYRRAVEDLEMQLRRLRRDRENRLDMSPTNADSLILGKDFDAPRFTQEDVAIGVEIRNIEIKLEIAQKRYQELFGGN